MGNVSTRQDRMRRRSMSRRSLCLSNYYQTWSVRYLPMHVLESMSVILGREGRANQAFVTNLMAVVNIRFDDNRLINFQAIGNDARAVGNRILFCLQEMQRYRPCHGSWCPNYREHWRNDDHHCYTIGGLYIYIVEQRLPLAAREIDLYFENSRINPRYQNPHLCLVSIFSDLKHFLWRRRNELDSRVLLDLNSLGETEIRQLLETAFQVKGVTPYIIPEWLEVFDQEFKNRWTSFARKQIELLGPRSIVVMKANDDLDQGLDNNLGQDIENPRIESRRDALLYVYRCAQFYHRSVIFLEEREEEQQQDDDEEYEEQAMNDGNNVHNLFGDRFNLERRERFVEALLMCPYVAVDGENAWNARVLDV